jgi:hypothetical protein
MKKRPTGHWVATGVREINTGSSLACGCPSAQRSEQPLELVGDAAWLPPAGLGAGQRAVVGFELRIVPEFFEHGQPRRDFLGCRGLEGLRRVAFGNREHEAGNVTLPARVRPGAACHEMSWIPGNRRSGWRAKPAAERVPGPAACCKTSRPAIANRTAPDPSPAASGLTSEPRHRFGKSLTEHELGRSLNFSLLVSTSDGRRASLEPTALEGIRRVASLGLMISSLRSPPSRIPAAPGRVLVTSLVPSSRSNRSSFPPRSWSVHR